MMNQSTKSNEGGSEANAKELLSITYSEYLEALEAQRLLLLEQLMPCDNGVCEAEPHAYHSDDTNGDLNAALEIYHALFDMMLQSSDQVIEDLTRWLNDLAVEAESYELPDDSENDFDEPLPPFSCDGVSGAFQTLYTRIYRSRKAEG